MPTLKILAEAAEEAEAAADWYEREQPGLSRQFSRRIELRWTSSNKEP
jgi:hypothetical protein